jgi:hypothetical protein
VIKIIEDTPAAVIGNFLILLQIVIDTNGAYGYTENVFMTINLSRLLNSETQNTVMSAFQSGNYMQLKLGHPFRKPLQCTQHYHLQTLLS